MEKINTPLGELRDYIQLRIDELNIEKETHYASFNEHGVDICDTVINELSLIKEKIFNSLPTEKEVMINIHNQGKSCVANELPSLSGIRKDSEKWFT